MPDLVPVGQRGFVGGWVAVAQTLGIVGGVGIATATGGVRRATSRRRGAVVVLAVPYLLRSHDVALPLALRPGGRSLATIVRGFWLSPRAHPDFAWAWLTRFLVNLGNSMGTLLLYFYLDDAVDLTDDPETGVLRAHRRSTRCSSWPAPSSPASGRTGSGAARAFVIVAGLVSGAAALTLALLPAPGPAP